MKNLKMLLMILLLSIPFSGSLAQNNGSIKGQIISAEERSPLPYTNIIVVGTSMGTATDDEGNFFLRNIDSDKVELEIVYVGYRNKIIEVNIIPNRTVDLGKIELEHSLIQGEEIVVTAQAQGQLEAINQQINSNTIKNVVSPERLQENPDANAAEAIGRLPGISLIRSGGEGQGIVIRGMKPEYSNVNLNGIQLTSTDPSNRNTSISSISLFLLQFVEVFKVITPDMDGNSVAGSINLKLSKAPDSLVLSLLAQHGYNNQNEYWKNYKYVGDISSRFFNKKLGIRLNLDIERVNRSTQTMGANYYIASNTSGGLTNEQVLLHSVGLNDIHNVPNRLSGTFVIDYDISNNSQLFFYNLLSKNDVKNITVNKFNDLQFPTFSTNINQANNNIILFSTNTKLVHTFSWADIDYGFAFSQTENSAPENRSWSLLPYGISQLPITNEVRSLSPQDALSSIINEEPDLGKIVLYSMGLSKDDLYQKNVTPYLNLKFPFSFGNSVSGYIKGGGKYNYVYRKRNFLIANQNPTSISRFGTLASNDIDWITLNSSGMVNSQSLVDHEVNGFYDGEYNFGWYPNLDRTNELWDWWNNLSNKLLSQGKQTVIDQLGSVSNVSFIPDILNSSISNQQMDEKYIGFYLMSEINLGKKIMFLPGARYERVTNKLVGHSVTSTASTYGLSVPGTTVKNEHNDEFLLPMIHLRIKPSNWMQTHLSFTQTLKRPDYVSLVPNEYINNTFGANIYTVGNPDLKPELWTSYDLQLVFYSNMIGMLSLNGFYKQVKDKIWSRTYKRLPDDPIIPGFEQNAVITVTETVNHQYPGFLRGFEIEWQTRFWYLPSLFKYFSFNANFTSLKSEIRYPITRVFTTVEIGPNGRPTATLNRVDSTITDRMDHQPSTIANLSLGFNYKGFNAWMSFQYNGETLTGWSNQKELIPYQISFTRFDFQVSQKLPLRGMELLFNVANINNHKSASRLKGDVRPYYLESYGWTSDLGFRYRF